MLLSSFSHGTVHVIRQIVIDIFLSSYRIQINKSMTMSHLHRNDEHIIFRD